MDLGSDPSANCYWLRKGVYCTDAGDSVVFLDLATDRYSALPAPTAKLLGSAIRNWPIGSQTLDLRHLTPNVRSTLDVLVQNGLLTTDSNQANAASEPPACETYLGIADVMDHFGKFRVTLASHLLAAFLLARRLLTSDSIDRVVRYVTAQQSKPTSVSHKTAPLDLAALAHFHALRPLLYSAKDQCILDSLVLYEYLRRCDAGCTFFIGVKTRPFRAHCWIQSGTVVLNDNVEHASSFRPILWA